MRKRKNLKEEFTICLKCSLNPHQRDKFGDCALDYDNIASEASKLLEAGTHVNVVRSSL